MAFFDEGFVDVDDVGAVAAVAVGAAGVDEDILFIVERALQCAFGFLALRGVLRHGVDAA